MSKLQALVVTDLVDSTRITEQLGDEAASALVASHDRATRDLLRAWRGSEISRTDGFLMLFDTVDDALGFAAAYHRAVARLEVPLKARVGVHYGYVALRTNAPSDVVLGAMPTDVSGIAVPTTARAMSVAAGGQTLLTAAARHAVGNIGARIESRGYWRFKGIAEPIELFEAGDPSMLFAAPADSGKAYRVVRRGDLWLPLRELRHSLPAERDVFVGRSDDLREIASRFEAGCRLVTVVGVGGSGKTRLSKRYAWLALGDFSGGSWFCDLSQARSIDGLLQAVAQGLGVPLDANDPVAQIGEVISGRHDCLVILDNFEQIVRFAYCTVGLWLERAPEARFLVTTRETLNVVGEAVLPIAPMPRSEGTELFLRRMHEAAGFKPRPDDEASISALIDLLDGLPLAIELAAARVRIMPLRELQHRMRERFRLLVSRRGRHDRQATLRATFDWSWELLDTAERTAFAHLSVFKGGFTLGAMERVIDLSTTGGTETVDVLQSLVEKSLVRRVDEVRFDLLPSIADYAAEHLVTPGRFPGSGPDGAQLARERHWKYFATLDERAATAGQCVEIDNLIEACRAACAAGDSACAAGALVASWMALRLTGPFRVAIELANELARALTLAAADRANLCWVAGSALFLMGKTQDANAQFDQGLVLAREARDARVQARLLWSASEPLEASARRDEAFAYLQEALRLSDTVGDRSLACHVRNNLGSFYEHEGELERARQNYEMALDAARELGDARMEGGLLGNLGSVLHGLGSLDAARTHYERALALARSVGDRRWEGNARSNFGLLHYDELRLDEAHAEFEAALAMAREMGHARLECVVLCNLGIVLAAREQQSAACDCYEQAIDMAHRLDDRRSEGQFCGYLGLLYARMGRSDDAIACMDRGEALLAAATDMVSLGLLLCSRAEVEVVLGDAKSAGATLARAEPLVKRSGAAKSSELGRAYAAAAKLVAAWQPT